MVVHWTNHAWGDDPNPSHWWSPSRTRTSLRKIVKGATLTELSLTIWSIAETTKKRGWYCAEIIFVKTPLSKFREGCRANQYKVDSNYMTRIGSQRSTWLSFRSHEMRWSYWESREPHLGRPKSLLSLGAGRSLRVPPILVSIDRHSTYACSLNSLCISMMTRADRWVLMMMFLSAPLTGITIVVFALLP